MNMNDYERLKKEIDEEEKEKHPEHETTGGYLKTMDYKEAFVNSFNSADPESVKLLLKLPNFNFKVFEKISGISRKMILKKLGLTTISLKKLM